MKIKQIVKKSLAVILILNILPVLFAVLSSFDRDSPHISIWQGYCAGLIMDGIGIAVIGFIFLATWLLISK